MGRLVDSVIAYRILRMLTTPFIETDAYKLGIIDNKGKELKKMSQLHTGDELAALEVEPELKLIVAVALVVGCERPVVAITAVVLA